MSKSNLVSTTPQVRELRRAEIAAEFAKKAGKREPELLNATALRDAIARIPFLIMVRSASTEAQDSYPLSGELRLPQQGELVRFNDEKVLVIASRLIYLLDAPGYSSVGIDVLVG
jgi:hypothetical protein